MADVEEINEQTLRDAKQQGKQGNVIFNKDTGRLEIHSDDDMGGEAPYYSWGQNEKEVLLKRYVAPSTKGSQVKLTTTSKSIKLTLDGHVLCDGALHNPIISDESTFSLEKNEFGGKQLVVTLVKRTETHGNEHWPYVIPGEGEVDTSNFGVPVKTVSPYDKTAMDEHFGPPGSGIQLEDKRPQHQRGR
jgi:hypothetical protein